MLRITVSGRPDATTQMTLEGRLAGPWVSELRRAVASSGAPTLLVLEMSGVIFADAAGVALVRRTIDEGARLVGVSPYLEQQLGLEGPE